MSRIASAFAYRRKTTKPPALHPQGVVEDTIVEDLRAFARDLGVHGVSAMSKTELVETLRQRYLLEQIRVGAGH